MTATTMDRQRYHARAVAAIARRDSAIYFSYPLQFVVRMSQLLFAGITLYFVAKLVRDAPELERYRGDYFSFALSGILVVSFVTLGLTAFATTLTDEQRNGTLETLLSTPVDLFTLMVGSLTLPLGLTLLSDGVLFAIGTLGLGFHVSASGLLFAAPVLAAIRSPRWWGSCRASSPERSFPSPCCRRGVKASRSSFRRTTACMACARRSWSTAASARSGATSPFSPCCRRSCFRSPSLPIGPPSARRRAPAPSARTDHASTRGTSGDRSWTVPVADPE
jgi:hypothetical protein